MCLAGEVREPLKSHPSLFRMSKSKSSTAPPPSGYVTQWPPSHQGACASAAKTAWTAKLQPGEGHGGCDPAAAQTAAEVQNRMTEGARRGRGTSTWGLWSGSCGRWRRGSPAVCAAGAWRSCRCSGSWRWQTRRGGAGGGVGAGGGGGGGGSEEVGLSE